MTGSLKCSDSNSHNDKLLLIPLFLYSCKITSHQFSPQHVWALATFLWIRIVNLKWLPRISEAVKIVDLLFASCLRGLGFWQHSFGWRVRTGHNKYLMIYMLTLKAERVSKIKKNMSKQCLSIVNSAQQEVFVCFCISVATETVSEYFSFNLSCSAGERFKAPSQRCSVWELQVARWALLWQPQSRGQCFWFYWAWTESPAVFLQTRSWHMLPMLP